MCVIRGRRRWVLYCVHLYSLCTKYNITIYDVYIIRCIRIQVDGGGLDDLEHVISTKDSLQNHLSLAMHINHTGSHSLHGGGGAPDTR